MLDVAVGVITNLFAFATIGFGPALLFLSPPKRFTTALAIAPTVGFAVTSVFGTYLVSLDKPVSEWATLWLSLSGTVSFVLCFAAIWKEVAQSDLMEPRLLATVTIGLGLTTVLVIAPALVGGPAFTTLRGNGTDTFNYITAAGYLDNEPYSWALGVDVQTLIDRHPSYYIARQFLSSRWTASVMLAYTSRIAHLPIWRFEYGFSVLCFILAFGPAFCFALLANLRPLRAAAVATTISVGFWAQLVLDIRAMSQMNSIPIILLLALLVGRIESISPRLALREHTLFAIASVALLFLYVETVPLLVLALMIFFGIGLVHGSGSFRRMLAYGFSLCIVVVGALPAGSLLIRFFVSQMTYAATGVNNWDQAYFSWLYATPGKGFWGLSGFLVERRIVPWVSPMIIRSGMSLLAALLSLGLVSTVVYSCIKKDHTRAVRLAASFILASFIQFFLLLAREQRWAAGKALSFGYPFVVLGVTGLLPMTRLAGSRRVKAVAAFLGIAISLWIATQCLLGIYRIALAVTKQNYPNYIGSHGEYRRHDWNIGSFSKALRGQRGTTVWLSASNMWVVEYLDFVLGWDVKLINLDGVKDRRGVVIGQQSIFHLPEYLLVEKNRWWATDETRSQVIAENEEFVLIALLPEQWNKPLLIDVRNPNGLEKDPRGTQFFWIGGDPTQLRLVSFREGPAVLKGRFVMGPSLPGQAKRNLLIKVNETEMIQQINESALTQEVRIAVRQGLNELALQSLEPPSISVLASGDMRPLLLGVLDLQVD